MVNISTSSTSSSAIEAPGSSQTRAMAMVTSLFFVWGFLTALNDILIPHLQSVFDLNNFGVMFIQFGFFGAYFIFAIFAGKIVETLGYKKTMVGGLLTMALGALLFVPAASVPSYPIFLAAFVILGAGITALQVAANPYVSVLGPARTASSRLNLTQAFNSLGTTIAPYLGGLVILTAAPLTVDQIHKLSAEALLAYHQQEASTVKLPYIGIAGALIALALAVAIFKLPRIEATRDIRPGDLAAADSSIWRQPQLLLGTLGIFFYVGAEVAIGSFLIKFFSQPEIGNLTFVQGSKYVTYYWGGAMIGRFIGSAILQRIRTGTLLGIVAVVAFLLVGTCMLTSGHVAMYSILLVGFFNSVMFPSIFTLGIEGLGPLTGEGSGLLIMAIVGGAIIPVAEGALADKIGIHHAFILPALCYIYIAYFGFRSMARMGKDGLLKVPAPKRAQ